MQCSKVFRIPCPWTVTPEQIIFKQVYGVITKGTGILNTVDPIGHDVRILLLVSCNLIGQ